MAEENRTRPVGQSGRKAPPRTVNSPRQKEVSTPIDIAEQIVPEVNRHYQKVSYRYLLVGVFALLLLVMYIIGVTLFFSEYVTYDNLKYLVKDFDAMSVTGSVDAMKIVYNGSDNMTFAGFKNGLALCDTDEYRYYDTSGVLLAEESLGYANPMMETSGKYVLVYDLGGKRYCVFNQITQIISRETSGDLIAGAMADDGSLALAMRSNETRYVVELFNGAFANTMSVYKDNYVMALGISPDGKTVAIGSACPSDSDFDCEIEIVRRGKEEAVATLKYAHAMPLHIYATDDGFAILCSNELLFIGLDGEVIRTVTFSGMSLKYADFNEDTAALVGSTNALGSVNRVLVFDMKNHFGDTLYDHTVNSRVRGVAATQNPKKTAAYLKLSTSVAELTSSGELLEDSIRANEVLSMIPFGDDLLVCTRSSAYKAFEPTES